MVAETRMPQAFYQLSEHIEAHSANSFEAAESDRAGLFRTYNDELSDLQSKQTDLKKLLEDVVTANTEHRVDGKRQGTAKFEEIMSLLTRTSRPDVTLLNLDSGGAELAIRPADEIRATLTDALAASSRSLMKGLANALDALVDANQVGRISWMADDVCRFFFFKNVIDTQATDRRTFRDRRETDWTRTYHNMRIVHDVIDERRVRVTSENLEGMRMPRAARKLVNRIPDWLASAAYIVEGQEIRVSTEERSAHIDSWTEVEAIPIVEARCDFDPALVLGGYVLTAW